MSDQNPPVVIGTTISQGTVNQDSNRYSVTVPPGFYEGDIFNIGIGSRMLSVRVPLGMGPGSTFIISISEGTIPSADIILDASRNMESNRTLPRYDKAASYTWIVFDMLILSLFISSFSVSTLAKQEISAACNVLNPYTGAVISKMYFILYKGLCSTKSAQQSSSEFCIPWEDKFAWNYFDKATGATTSSENASLWPAVQALLPVAAGLTLISLIMKLTAIFQNRDLKGNEINLLLISYSSTFLIFAWVCGLFGTNFALYSQSMSSFLWERFFIGGNEFSKMLNSFGSPTASPAVAPSSDTLYCNVVLKYNNDEGLLFVIIALPLAFFMSWFIVCANCLGLALEWQPRPFYNT